MVTTVINASSTAIGQWEPLIDNFALNSGNPAGDVFVRTPTSFVVRNADGTFTRVTGVGLTYNVNNVPNGGTITQIEHASASAGGTVFATINTFVAANNSAAIAGGFLFTQDMEGLGAYLFSQSDTFSTADGDGTEWSGENGNDQLVGGGGADQLDGGAGNDILAGNAGADTLLGGIGNDGLFGLGGNDSLDGGAGIDEVRYDVDALNGGGGAVNVNLALGTATDGFGNTDTLANVEIVRGTALADTLTGGNAANDGFEAYSGLAGNDTISGGTGFDEVRYDQDAANGGAATITVNLITQTAIDGFGNTDTLISIEGARGTAGADTFIGNSFSNTFTGVGGADTIDGGGGNDEVRYDVGGGTGVNVNLATGTANDNFGGIDTLVSIELVRGSNLADTLTGGNVASDRFEAYRGLGGNDTISGGTGFDEVRYDQDANNGGIGAINVNLAAGTAIDGFGNTDSLAGIEAARGTAGNDTFLGDGLNNTFAGLAGFDLFTGGDGFDEVQYQNDVLFGGAAAVTVNLLTGFATDGFGNIDSLNGFQGIRGTSGGDTFIGSDFVGFFGDGFLGLAGNDTISGGLGFDEVRYDDDADLGGLLGVTVNLEANTATDGFGNIDLLTGIDNVRGTNQADSLTGDAGINSIRGLGGSDAISGGDGSDEAAYDRDADNGGLAAVTVDLDAGTATDGFGNTDTLLSIERARGTAGADSLIGSAADNGFVGLAGNDTISGGAGTDELRYDVDFVFGGAAGVTVNLATGTATDGFGNTDALSSIENVRGTRSADTFIGGSADEVFYGLGGNDTITGGSGVDWASYSRDIQSREESQALIGVSVNLTTNTAIDSFGNTDTLSSIENASGGTLGDALTGNAGDNAFRGFAGNDTINGLGGIDTIDYSQDRAFGDLIFSNGASAINVNLGTGSATDGFGNTDTLLNIENAIGTEFNDMLTGNATANNLDGGAGTDTMVGGDGNDTYSVDAAGDVTTETSAAGGIDTVLSTISRTLGSNIENLQLTGTANINGTGNTLDNVLTGNSGANVINGGAGVDTMIGGDGNDTYSVSVAQDVTTETSATGGIDTVLSAVSRTLGANLENLTLVGSSAINATGNTLDNVLIGNSGANTLNGGAGADTMIGGDGNDTYSVNTAQDVTTETSATGGIDTVLSAVSRTLDTNIENLSLAGAAAINATGNTLNNNLVGNSGANVLDGGVGADTMVGGDGNDSYRVDVAQDVTTETSDMGGIDTVISSVSRALGANFENLTLIGSASINATGNTLDNVLTGNSGANALNGGAGADTMIGGDGNDTYSVNVAQDVTTETSITGGIDTVLSAVSRTLGANLENLTLVGSSAINATGNTLDNVLTGNSGANTLNGGAGADTMIGGDGNDTYSVNATQDVTSETSLTGGTDTVLSAVSRTLGNNLENLTLVGSSAISATGNSLDNILTGNSGANVLEGGGGADTIVGGIGNDVIVYNTANLGVDTITDFVGGSGIGDRINVHTLFADFDTVSTAVSQQGADTVITLDGSNQIILHNFTAANLAADDFIF